MSKRVAISVKSMNGLESMIDPRFGRAFAYVVIDVDTNTVVAELENPTRHFAHGAGTEAVAMLASNNVNAVISGRFGPKAFQALSRRDIEMWTAPEGTTTGEAITGYVFGNLTSGAPRIGDIGAEEWAVGAAWIEAVEEWENDVA